MFPWKIAKSAEAMFSRWAVKRVCKFLLKKKLGQFILGDIDLDQLDVQLSNGTIQLTDLALNVDFLNKKLSAAAGLYIKEGSIGSLLLKMPWNGKGCQLELDEFEVVLAPCKHNSSPDKDGVKKDSDSSNNSSLEKHEKEMLANITSSHGDVHEGVKIIAKMVKWLLTSFHVKIKKLIVAYDPHLEKNEDTTLHHTMMVLRIEEIECGTCLFEDMGMQGAEGVDNIFGMNRLSNYVTFDGAIVELVEVDDVTRETCCASVSGTSSSDLNSEILPSYSRKPLVSGKGGGFSGNLRLSIPWLNGSLDIQKVDADVCLDPIDLRFDPSSIKWLLISWETFKYLGQGEKVHHNPYESAGGVQLNSISSSSSPTHGYPRDADDGFSSEVSPLPELGSIYDLKLPHLISDWVPSSVDDVEQDFDASVDQFFSCIDGMRSTQSALGGSGVWNWTCSVFNALTATSSLASGSLPIPSEQQHVETNLKVTVAGISLMFCFQDESDDLVRSGLNLFQEKIAYNYHYLALECADISLILKICPRDLKIEGSIRSIEVDHYICQVDHDLVALRGLKYDIPSKTCMIQQLQSKVEDALPQRASSVEVSDKTSSGAIPTLDIPLRKNDDIVKVTLFRTSGILHCKFLVKFGVPIDNSATSISFSLKLPPFVFWVNFHLIAKMLIFMREVQSVVQLDARRKSPHAVQFTCSDNDRTGLDSTRKGVPGPCFTTLSSEERLQGNISVSEARIILCSPSQSDVELATYSSWEWDLLIALDIYSPFGTNEDCSENLKPSPDASSDKRFSLAVASSLCLNVGNLDVFLITSASEDDRSRRSATSMVTRKFTSQKIVSVANGAGYSVIQVIWQDGPVTGPWIVERAKSSAWSRDTQNRNKFMQEHDFISATAVNDLEDCNCQVRQEIILSSAILVHVHLVPVVVHLGRPQYEGIHYLIKQMIEGFTSSLHDGVGYAEESAKFQTSILVECESLEFVVKPDKITDLKSSMQSELPGSWCKLTLRVKKFELLYTSDLGGINGANFFWLSHGEGKLLGSISSVPGQEFLLISCSDSAIKRGDGEGSNALSAGFSGLDVASLHDPRSSNGYLSITVRGATVIANGGRLDWFDALSSVFTLPSAETENSGETPFSEADSQPSSTSWFALNLVDVAMSYEPYSNKLVLDCRSFDSASIHSSGHQKVDEHCVACILAVSSLSLTQTAEVGSSYNEYLIGVQDMGVLLCAASELDFLLGVYSAQHLRKVGFVKIAGETIFQAKLRTYSLDGIKWHLECSNPEINVETCHDTTSALIKLSSQLQQLFAPDIEESLVHLQHRWDSHQQSHVGNTLSSETEHSNGETAPATPQVYTSSVKSEDTPVMVGLMDEICEDAFVSNTIGGRPSVDAHHFCTEAPTFLPCDLSLGGPVPLMNSENSRTSVLQNDFSPDFIEGYCLSDLRSLSELTLSSQSSGAIPKYRSHSAESTDVGGKSGWYWDSSLTVLDDHMSDTSDWSSLKQSVNSEFASTDCADLDDCESMGRITVKNLNFRWRMYGGTDWDNSRTSRSPNRVYGRDRTVCMELLLSDIECQYNSFPIGQSCVSKLSFTFKDIHLRDNSRDAPLKQVLGYYHSKDHPRDSASQAFRMELEAFRPDPSIPLEEYRLCISVIPLRLNLHQRQLEFFINFFGGEDVSRDLSPDGQKGIDRSKSLSVSMQDQFPSTEIVDEALLPYFQKFDIKPLVVRVDYIPERVDLAALSGGKYVELVNLIPWKGVELQLKPVHAVGVYGWANVGETIAGEWLEDISQNQISKVLRGIPAIRSVTSIGSAAAKLISCPVENYKKDGRVLKGVQRGTIAFLRSISLEAVGLGVHLAAGAHDILLQAEYVLASKDSAPGHGKSRTTTNVRSNQPKGAQHGIQKACGSIRDGLGKSASALIQKPVKKYQLGEGPGAAIATAVRGVPTAAISPVSACAGAFHYAFLGLRNSLDPEHKKESMEKYMGSDPSRE